MWYIYMFQMLPVVKLIIIHEDDNFFAMSLYSEKEN